MSDPGSETTAGAETATALPRSRSATAALILGILGLPSYPIDSRHCLRDESAGPD